MSDIKEKLRKVYELSVHGVGGERETAQRTLKALLAKYELTIDQIADEARSERKLPRKTKEDERLLIQVIGKVKNTAQVETWKYVWQKNVIGFSATNAEFAEIKLLYDDYRAGLKREHERVFAAFVQANSIFPTREDEGEHFDLTPEQIAEIRRTLQMAQAMSKVEISRNQLRAEVL